ncbi:hypothetical protein AM493_03370 [Flavobacterium akiainvivens]|uniref:Secretion system C-terminal sorting domain-containing protein n=1 Tax=Flavobacterium akiainvivens TaxID=1202724 RepID=A0A0N0RQF6_9FLAO|nr:T9SS type A sorting domain-containing protein [Flavobacterium akiainvivens]KOS05180.1 hypothetical protein AM493_03370 [Flavobacterium akiainvivens]SFQ50847.1 Por secretion system C-terminal sorting domain-containing protein [Flavobacterium akiainvivens]
MKVKQLLKNNIFKTTALLGISLFAANTHAQVFVTVNNFDATADNEKWRSYRNVFLNNGAFEAGTNLAYEFGDQWVTFDELKSVFNTGEGTIALYPNYTLYNAADAYWSDGNGNGNKIFEGLTFVERTDMEGEQLVFSGHTNSSTLIASYHDTAFIKILNPAANWATEVMITVPLTPGEDFTLSTGDFEIGPGRYVQYGFSMLGLNGNPANEAATGFTVVTNAPPGENPITPEEPVEPTPGTVNVTIENLDTENLWKPFANWFENNGNFEAGTELTYVAGNSWTFDALKSVLNPADNTISIYPNYNTYNPADTYWADGNGNGNKIFEGNTFVERTDLAAQTLIFTGKTVSSTLTDDFEDVAFIKILNPGNNWSLDFHASADLVPGQDWSLSTEGFTITAGLIVQYGVSVTGLNQNPANGTEEANGFTVVTSTTANAPAFNKFITTVYPNPVSDVLNITNENAIDTVEIYNLIGQLIYTAKPAQNNVSVNVSNLNAGVYIVNTSAKGKQTSQRIIKQ